MSEYSYYRYKHHNRLDANNEVDYIKANTITNKAVPISMVLPQDD